MHWKGRLVLVLWLVWSLDTNFSS